MGSAGVVGVAVAFAVATALPVSADIYSYRDGTGALVFSNAPGAPSRLVMRELADVPPIPIVHLPRPAGGARASYDTLIRQVAAQHGVEYALVKAVVKAESAFDRLARSPKGAMGLMQLMPGTAADNHVRDVFHPRDNIEGGCRHLRMLLDRYGGDVTLAVAAYNAGQGRVDAAGGVPAISETQEYVARVLKYRLGYLRDERRDVAFRR